MICITIENDEQVFMIERNYADRNMEDDISEGK